MSERSFEQFCDWLRRGLKTGNVTINGSLLVDVKGVPMELHIVGNELIIDSASLSSYAEEM